jgi:hypothetical protein
LLHLLKESAGDGNKKTPHLTAGFRVSFDDKFYRARQLEVPGRGPFFEASVAHEFVIMCKSWSAAAGLSTARIVGAACHAVHEKKPGSEEPGLVIGH